MSRYRIDGSSSAPGIAFSAYLVVFGLLAAYFYFLMQPQNIPNPGLAAYKPPPATVIDYATVAHYQMPAQSPAQPQQEQAPPVAEIESRPEEPKPTVAEPQRERKVAVKKPKRPGARTASRARNNPYGHYATPYSRGRGYPYGRYATPYYGYWGYRAF